MAYKPRHINTKSILKLTDSTGQKQYKFQYSAVSLLLFNFHYDPTKNTYKAMSIMCDISHPDYSLIRPVTLWR